MKNTSMLKLKYVIYYSFNIEYQETCDLQQIYFIGSEVLFVLPPELSISPQ